MIIVLFFIVFLAEIATDLYIPSLPSLAQNFTTTNQIVQLTMSLHLLGFALGQPIYGLLSDRYGRQIVLFSGFSLFVVASLGCALSQSITTLIIFRTIQGLGACVAPVIALAVLKDKYLESSKNIKMVALMSMVMSSSPIIGPIFGSVVASYWGWRGNFLILFGFGILTLPYLFTSLKKIPANIKTIRVPFLKILDHKNLRRLILLNAVLVSIVWLFISEVSYLLIQTYGMSLIEYSFYQIITVAGYILGGLIAYMLANKLTSRLTIQIGFGTITMSGIGMIITTQNQNWLNPNSFIALIALFECGLGILRPPLLNTILDYFPPQKGAVSGLIGTCEMVVSSLVIFSLTFTPTKTLLSLSYLVLGLIIIAFCFGSIFIRKKKQSHGDLFQQEPS